MEDKAKTVLDKAIKYCAIPLFAAIFAAVQSFSDAKKDEMIERDHERIDELEKRLDENESKT